MQGKGVLRKESDMGVIYLRVKCWLIKLAFF